MNERFHSQTKYEDLHSTKAMDHERWIAATRKQNIDYTIATRTRKIYTQQVSAKEHTHTKAHKQTMTPQTHRIQDRNTNDACQMRIHTTHQTNMLSV